MSELNDPRRLIGNLMRLGTIESLDLGQATGRVRVGELVTGDLPIVAPRAGAVRIWAPPSIGEQVLLLCPEGDIQAGVILGGLFSDAHPAPAGDTRLVIDIEDGTRLVYDRDAHHLGVQLGGNGTAEISAPGGITLNADVQINGKLGATGKITSDDDVLGGGKSLKGHKHLQVQPGSGISGLPQ